ncbi:MAG: hypothetical protein QW837_08395 [Conexivisphaerales archaeon]
MKSDIKPFYFKSYQKTVGIAHDVEELKEKIQEIGSTDPSCVNYHLSQGHIVSWLQYIGEDAAAEALKGVNHFEEALKKLEEVSSVHEGEHMMGSGMMQHRQEMMQRKMEMMKKLEHDPSSNS